jgi:hypothetical protein
LGIAAFATVVHTALVAARVVLTAAALAIRGSPLAALGSLAPLATTGALLLALHACGGWALGHPGWTLGLLLLGWLGVGASPFTPHWWVPVVGAAPKPKTPRQGRTWRVALASAAGSVAGAAVHAVLALYVVILVKDSKDVTAPAMHQCPLVHSALGNAVG